MNNSVEVRHYMINFFATIDNIGAIQQYLKDSADVLGYWNYIPLCFCIKTRLSAQQLREKLINFTAGAYIIIAEINPNNIDGWLPREAWEWFRLPPLDRSSRPQPIQGLLELFQANETKK